MTREVPAPPSVRDLVFEYLERVESEGTAVLEEICAREPQHEKAVRARVAVLEGTGLSETSAETRAVPERLGPFVLGHRIGGGGMGVVYEARDSVLARDVAVKVIRPSELLFQGARARFQREVEAVASLSHPGIVPVYSAGDEAGIPYFAMERVEGCTLAEALEAVASEGRDPAELAGGDLGRAVERASGVEEGRAADVALFTGSWVETCARAVREVALALEHAHERGILHRDVKPSNVMVTPEGRIMLLDFGLSSSDDVERITKSGSALGSLPYMSPEQIDGDWERLDRRTDVYSLGVTLYELLTLALPYRSPSIAGLRAMIAEGRRAPVRRANPRVTWEMETILEVAMEPDMTRRYASGDGLAGDLEAALDGRPIEARRVGALRRTTRWVQRRPAAAGLVALSAAVVVGGPLVFGLQQRRARLDAEAQGRVIAAQRGDLADKNVELEQTLLALGEALQDAREQRDEAEAQEGRAERNFQRALAAVDELLTRIGDQTLRDVPGLQPLRRAILSDALAFYQSLLEDQRDDPRLRFETARAWVRVGDIQGRLDRITDAEASFVQARTILEELQATDPKSAAVATELAAVRGQLAQCRRAGGRLGAAIAELEAALVWIASLDVGSAERASLDDMRRTLLVDLADAQRDAGRLGDVIETLEPLMPELIDTWSAEAPDREAAGRLTRAALLLGSAHTLRPPVTLASHERSQGHLELAVEVAEVTLEEFPEDTLLRFRFARGLINLGNVVAVTGGHADGRELLERGLDAALDLREDFPDVIAYAIDEGTARSALGSIMALTGDLDAGLEMLREGQVVLEGLVGGTSVQRDAVELLASNHLQETILLWRLANDVDGALAALEPAVEMHERALELRPGAPAPKLGLERCHEHAAWIRYRAGDLAGAAEAALVWSEVVTIPQNRVAIAMILAGGAHAAEEAGAADDAALFDEVAAEMLQRALDAGFDPDQLKGDADLDGLRARPNAWAPFAEDR
ncbi:MAG: serine/threonine-protein kinase [Planctomycetota bacterium]